MKTKTWIGQKDGSFIPLEDRLKLEEKILAHFEALITDSQPEKLYRLFEKAVQMLPTAALRRFL